MSVFRERIPVRRRLEAKYIPEPNSGCWLWLGSVNPRGYGNICHMGSNRLAHRVSWIINRGPIPDGMHVCHKCDVPSCINPNHMFLGTDKDNMADCSAKGRNTRLFGERSGMSKLSDEQVLAIKTSAAPRCDLARQYGITKWSVWWIRSGRGWGHLNALARPLPAAPTKPHTVEPWEGME